jgi:Fic family protein
MSYIEEKKLNNKSYFYFVKKISFLGKLKVIKKNIGVGPLTVNKEKYILDYLEELSNEEFKFRKGFLNQIKKEISYGENLPEKIELKSIRIDNLIEGKTCKNAVYTEFAKEFIFNSNNIEGSKIPPEIVKEIIDSGDTKYKDKNEVKEVRNSISSFEYLNTRFKFNIISIKRLYHLLTKDLLDESRRPYPKGFKKIPNIVGNSKTTAPEDVEKELINLLNWYKQNKNKLHPLMLAFEFHRRYEFIHPFSDGNGRTGRLIMNKILMSEGYSPIIVYKENKIAYFNSIKNSQEGRVKNYYQFMLEQVDKSYNFLLKVVEKY